MSRATPLVVAALLCSACSWLSASPYEYAAYRRTRAQPTLEERMSAATQYLEQYPKGVYADEVRAALNSAEPLFYKSRQTSQQGLEAYLAAMPQGPHAPEVRSRLQAIEELSSRPDSLTSAARSTEDRLRKAQGEREIARQEVAFYVDLLLDPALYQSPVSEGPAEFVTTYSLALPAPRCTTSETSRVCTKDLEFGFQVPTTSGLVERTLVMSVVLEEDLFGRPLRARVEGEELFLRLEETFAKRPLDGQRAEDRALAHTRAVELNEGAFGAKVSMDASCRRSAAAPVLSEFGCGGLTLKAVVAVEPGGLDRFEIEPQPSPTGVPAP